MTSPQVLAVAYQVEIVGAAKCDICHSYRADCVSFPVFPFVCAVVCDGCCSAMMKKFNRSVGGDARR